MNACGDSRLRGLRSRKPIGFRQWVVHIRYSTKIIAREHRVEKNTKKKEKYCRKTIENAEKLCYNKKAE